MAIYLKEYVGFSPMKTHSEKPSVKESSVAIAPQMISPNSLNVDIEGIHSILTINYNFYTENCLKNSADRWTIPYERPVIMHHKEEDGVIIGRVKNVEYKEKNTRSGTPCQMFTCNIGDPKGIEGIKNGTLSTVSIGAIVYDLRCSICGKNLAEEGECEHEKGQYYDGELCYWRVEEMEPKEISYVIVPSDKYALTTKIYKPKNATSEIKESVEEVKNKMSISEELLKSITESAENVKEAAVINEDSKDAIDAPKPKEAAKVEEDNATKEEQNPEIKSEEEEVKPEEVETEPEDNEKKGEEKQIKDEDDSNKDTEGDAPEDEKDKDAEVEELKKQIEKLEGQVADLKASLKTVKSAKESVDLELAKYKVKEKVEVATKIKGLKESLGINCEEADEMAKTSSFKELNLVYSTLQEACNFTKVEKGLPKKILQESVIDEEKDNLSIKESSNKQLVVDNEEFDNLLKNLGL